MRRRQIACPALVASLAALLVTWARPAAAQRDTSAVDELIRLEMRRQNIPGLSLAVLEDGELVKAAGYGVADIARRTPATPRTVYKIASVSKQFIATGIMLLVQEGRPDLADSVGRFLDDAPPAWRGITVQQLLTHTSGLVREAPGFDASRVQRDADVIRTAYSLPLRFAPGERWEYSNLGYFVLAEIIRRVSGQPWDQFLAERVFRPVGMHATRPTSPRDSAPDRAVGYRDNDRLLVARDWPALRPSGAFLSTVLDLARWDAALHDAEMLRDSIRRRMWQPVRLDDGTTYPYGLGWQLATFDGRRLVHHGGGMTGFRAYFAQFVDDGLTIIVLMNLDDVDPVAIVNGVARLYLRGAAAPGSRTRHQSPEEQMDRTPQWASLGFFPSGLAADIARQALEDAEIPVLVKGGQPGIFGPAFQGSIAGGIEVLVPDVALEQAREILGEDSD